MLIHERISTCYLDTQISFQPTSKDLKKSDVASKASFKQKATGFAQLNFLSTLLKNKVKNRDIVSESRATHAQPQVRKTVKDSLHWLLRENFWLREKKLYSKPIISQRRNELIWWLLSIFHVLCLASYSGFSGTHTIAFLHLCYTKANSGILQHNKIDCDTTIR